jgi:hypothetical protein
MANGLMEMLMPNEDEAFRRAMLAGSFGLLGTPKGRLGAGIGRAGLLGMGVYDDSLRNQTERNADKLKMAQYVAKMQAEQQAAQQQQEAMNALANMSTSQSSVTGPMAQFQQPGGASALMSGAVGGQTPPATQLATQMAAPPDDPAAQKLAQANYMEEVFRKTKNPTAFVMAQKLREEAMKMRDENQGFETVMGPDGTLKIVQPRKFGAPQEMPYAPKPDIKTVNANDRTEFYDALRPPASPIQHGLSPDTRFTGGITMRGQNMIDARAREAATGGGKPQWDAAAGMFVYPPSAESPTGRVVQPEGYVKPEKALTESQAKASAFANQMADASAKIAELAKKGFTGKSGYQQAQIVNAASTGIPYVPGSAAIPRMMSGADAQKYQQAELQWTEGALRFMTGANAPEAEVIRNAATYFPRPGDSDEVIAQKATARDNMEESVRLAAGAGNKKLPKMPGRGSSVRELADKILAGE